MAERLLPRLHAVTDDAILARPGFAAVARAVLERGGTGLAIHLRGPHTGGRELFELGETLARAAREHGAMLLVNDRVDVALAISADGAQLGRRSATPQDARLLLPAGATVGCSVGTEGEARAALGGGADFLLAGHVYATESHPGSGGIGPAGLSAIAALGAPTVAVGGVTPERVAEVRGAGAYGVAAVRAVWDADDPPAAVARFLEALNDADD